MAFLDLADFVEEHRDVIETFFARRLGKFRIHGRPFAVFAGRCRFQIVGRLVRQAAQEPEPNLGVRSFIRRRFRENAGDFFGIFFRFRREELVLHVRHRFSGKRRFQIFLRLRAGELCRFIEQNFFVHAKPPENENFYFLDDKKRKIRFLRFRSLRIHFIGYAQARQSGIYSF